MIQTCRRAAASENQIAAQTDTIAGQQQNIAQQQIQLGAEAKQVADAQATGDFIGGLIKGVAGIASIALAPATGGLSVAATAGLDGLGAIQ